MKQCRDGMPGGPVKAEDGKVGMNPWRRTEAYKEARKNRK